MEQLGIGPFVRRGPFVLTQSEDGTLERLRGQAGHEVEGAELVASELLGRGPPEPHRSEARPAAENKGYEAVAPMEAATVSATRSG